MSWPVPPHGFLGSQASTAATDNDTYQISRSLRFNSADSAYISKTYASGTSATTWTISCWVKRSSFGSASCIFSDRLASNTNVVTHLNFESNDTLRLVGTDTSGSLILNLIPTQVFRDPSAWFHLVIAADSTQAIASNRFKIYINGSQVTSFGTATYPGQNSTFGVFSASEHNIGRRLLAPTGADALFNGYISEFYAIDGQALTPSSFGETDAITGRWKAKAFSGNYGTNGFYLNFSDNSGATATTLGKDSAPISGAHTTANNWTPNNLSVTPGSGNDSLTDSPSNYGAISTTLVNDTYQISKSLRFNSLDSAYLNRTFSTPTSQNTWTYSCWAKFSVKTSGAYNFGPSPTGGNRQIWYDSALGTINWYNTTADVFRTSASFRDPSSWYHIVLSVNSGASGSNKVRLYVNGTEITSFSSDNRSSFTGSSVNTAVSHSIGRYEDAAANYFDGYLSEINFIDGQALTPDSFGTRDINTYLWKPKAYSGTYGTNGFYLSFSNSSSATTRNLLTYSEDFANGSWTNYQSTETSNVAVAPNGTTTADKLIPDAGALGGQFYRNYSAVDNTTYTFSVYAKAAEYTQLRLYIQKKATSATYDFADYDLASATVTATYGSPTSTSIVAVGNGWYRISISSNVGTGGTATPGVNIQHLGSAGNGSNGILLWGAQLEDSGTLGPYLRTDASATASTLRLGSDSSVSTGGYNSWFANNFSVLAGPGNDSLVDSPTYYGTDTGVGGEARGDYATLNPLFGNIGGIITDGNLTLTHTGGANSKNALGVSSIAMSTGKWYCEFTNTAVSNPVRIGIISSANTSIVTSANPYISQYADGYSAVVGGGTYKENNNIYTTITNFGGSSPVVNDVYMVAVDLDSNKVWFGRNGSWANSGNPATGATETYSILSGRSYYFACNTYSGDQMVANFGQRPFIHAAPSGFRALRDYNKLPTPTGGEVSGNYATLNPLNNSGVLSNGNLEFQASTTAAQVALGTSKIIPSGKTYFEVNVVTAAGAGTWFQVGIAPSGKSLASSIGTVSGNGYSIEQEQANDMQLRLNGSTVAISTVVQTSDVLQVAVDHATGKLWFGRNNTWYNSSGGTTGNPSAGTNETATISTVIDWFPAVAKYNTGGSYAINFGQRPWAYDAPFGFKPLCTTLLPQPIIQKPSSYMDVVTYTGNGAASQDITSLSFSPDLVWLKSRTDAFDHRLKDSTRGNSALFSNLTNAESAYSLDFLSNGIRPTLGFNDNISSKQYVAWAWDKAPIAGMDIVSYTGNGTTQNVSHALGVTPKMVIVKNRDTAATPWNVYHSGLTAGNLLSLNQTSAQFANTNRITAVSSSNFSVGSDSDVNQSTKNHIAYCFAEVEGFSKFGSYTGTGTTDGTFVWCGFRPRWVMVKRTDTAGENWQIKDSVRSVSNPAQNNLFADLSIAELVGGADRDFDFVSNGFKLRGNNIGTNASGGTYIFAAFAESPFKYARAR